MKKMLGLLGLVMSGVFCRGQNFFYIENNQVTEKSIREQLIKASQYVTHSPLSSDYIVQANANVNAGAGMLRLKMTVQDSVTFETVFQSDETITFSPAKASTRFFLRMTIASFIEKNIRQVVACTKEDRYDQKMQFLKSRKDKT